MMQFQYEHFSFILKYSLYISKNTKSFVNKSLDPFILNILDKNIVELGFMKEITLMMRFKHKNLTLRYKFLRNVKY